ncbi:hypothetical protein GCG54_00002542 [Colletotrichum gloeosporioides]|uniref:Uncharacterized protein n=1 Tax=Colletotrichum gloeosporioides TaxID=474922 RepID=A0A8H4CUJ0_COLGL|nr:uncharacterized protein GCG54_00002542 [Colletotrichum gloeosporioides]KAF3810091.1 hypothetical protein GCG54_00002542 [Colletotrichum gloeosporioides]
MSDISEEELKYLAENADRLVPYCPPGYFARIQAEALAARELKKKEEEKENEEEEEEENNNKKKKKKDEVNNDEEKSDEEGNENWEDDDEENEGWESEEDEHEDWGGYPNEGLPIIFHLSHFDYDKDGNLVPRVGPKTLALYYDEETGDYVGEVIAKVEPQEVEEQEAKQQTAKEQKIEQHNVEEPTKQPYSKPAPQRKPRTNLSLPKPIPAFPGYKNPDLRIKEDWTLPIDQVDWKALHYREVMRSREMGEWHRSQYRLAVKDCKKAWKKASQRLKEGRGVVMTEVVQEPDQLEI